MAVAFGAAGAYAYSAASPAPAYPAGIAAGDYLLLAVASKPDTAPAPAQTGWTTLGRVLGGAGATGADTGPTVLDVFGKVADGSETGTFTVAVSASNSVSWARIFRFGNATGQWSVAFAGGVDATTGTAWSAAMTSDPGLAAGDGLLVAASVPTDVAITWGTPALAATGATFGAVTAQGVASSALGNDIGGATFTSSVATGPATANATFTATLSGTTTNASGPAAIIRLREIAQATPATIVCTTTMPAPTVSAAPIITPAVVLAVVAMGVLVGGVRAGAGVSPAVIAGSALVHPARSNVTRSAVAVTYGGVQVQHGMAISAGTTAGPGVIAGSTSMAAPAVSSGSGAVTVTPSVVSGAATVPAPAPHASTTVTPAVTAGSVTVAAPTALAGATVTAATIAGAATVPAPSVSAGGSVTISAATVTGAATAAAPTVSASTKATPTTVTGATTVPAPTPRAGVTVTATTVSATTSAAAPTVSSASATTVNAATANGAVTIGVPSLLAGTAATVSAGTISGATAFGALNVAVVAPPAPRWLFRTPVETRDGVPDDARPEQRDLMRHYRGYRKQGVAVIVWGNGSVERRRVLHGDEHLTAAAVYLGGHENVVTNPIVQAALVAAGYDLTPI